MRTKINHCPKLIKEPASNMPGREALFDYLLSSLEDVIIDNCTINQVGRNRYTVNQLSEQQLISHQVPGKDVYCDIHHLYNYCLLGYPAEANPDVKLAAEKILKNKLFLKSTTSSEQIVCFHWLVSLQSTLRTCHICDTLAH